jgi:peptidoglycan L-alanyl-D-glutamate endopeptidase CwlK
MNKRSEAMLAKVNPELANRIRAAAEVLAANSTFLLVVSGLRTGPEQDALYAQGRTAPGHIVSNARAGQSMHNYGLAVDIVPYLQGETGTLNWSANTPQFRAMVAALEARDLVWGGSWKSFPDDDHFQMPGIPASPTPKMQADYGGGTTAELRAIWSSVASGNYTV